MRKYTHYIGLDVPKDTISVALAKSGRAAPTFYGQIASTPAALSQLVARLATKPGSLSFCYEAGPCGYGVYRQLQSMGYSCQVVAPSLIPRKPGDRLKTDRRDALQLARLHRSGDLTPVWVPDQEQEAIRDLVRCREDMKGIERHARQRLCGFLLRHGQVYGAKVGGRRPIFAGWLRCTWRIRRSTSSCRNISIPSRPPNTGSPRWKKRWLRRWRAGRWPRWLKA